MDNVTFTLVSAIVATGGALGTLVGFNNIRRERQNRLVIAEETATRKIDGKSNSTRLTLATDDVLETAGRLGGNAVYGMLAYSLCPVILMPSLLRHDFDQPIWPIGLSGRWKWPFAWYTSKESHETEIKEA